MGRIPTYDANIGGRAAQAPTISPNSYAPLNTATSQFGETAAKVFGDMGEKFAEAQRTNTVLDEENKMMDQFFKLSEEAKKQEPDKQVQWFDDQAKAYRDEMKNRVGDLKAVKALENTWQSFYMRGGYQVRNDYRQKIAADGVAKAIEGDDTFLKQVYSMYDQPTLLELGIKDRYDAYDKLVQAGHIGADDAAKYKKLLTHQVVNGRADFLVEKDPYSALKMLQDEKQLTDLAPHDRATYINKAQSEIKRAEALKRQEERERRMEVRAYLAGELLPMAQQAMKDAIESNSKSPEFTSIYRELSKYNGFSPSVTRTMDKMNRIGEVVSVVMDVKAMPTEQLGKQLNDWNAKWDQLSPDEREKARAVREVFDNQNKFFKQGQHLEYMNKYHLNGGVTPLAPNSGPEAINRRLAQIEYAKDTFGGTVNSLTDAEADAFGKAWKEGDEGTRQRIGNVLFRLAGGTDKGAPNPQKVNTITKQMHLKESSIADEIGFMIQGDTKLASLIGEGRKRLENNPDRYGQIGQTLNREMNRKIDELNLGAIDPNDTLRSQWLQGIKNLYVGMVSETTDTYDSNALEKAVKAYFPPVVEHNGYKTFEWAPGESSAGHTQIWRSFTPDLMKAASPSGELPKIKEGSQVREINFNEVVRKGVLIPEDGKYILFMPNKPMPWNDAKFVKAVDSKGKPYTVNMDRVLPDLTRIRDERYRPYGELSNTGP